MLSRTVEHAVRALVVLAREGQASMRAEEIAVRLGAPRNYLSKILNALARARVLTSARGPGGGFSLAMPPVQISIAGIIDVFSDDKPVATRCLLGDRPCDSADPCAAHRRWNAITKQALQPLLTTTIAELCDEPRMRVSPPDHDDTRASLTWPETPTRTKSCA